MDEVAAIDLLLHRYGNIDYILGAPYQVGAEFIEKAREQEREAMIWQMWISQFPNMSEKDFISFEDYKKKVLGSKNHTQTAEEQIAVAKMWTAALGGTVVEV